jgi:hypothetical protein
VLRDSPAKARRKQKSPEGGSMRVAFSFLIRTMVKAWKIGDGQAEKWSTQSGLAPSAETPREIDQQKNRL